MDKLKYITVIRGHLSFYYKFESYHESFQAAFEHVNNLFKGLSAIPEELRIIKIEEAPKE